MERQETAADYEPLNEIPVQLKNRADSEFNRDFFQYADVLKKNKRAVSTASDTVTPETYTEDDIGTKHSFMISYDGARTSSSFNSTLAELKAVGTYCYIWYIDDTDEAGIKDQDFTNLAYVFDSLLYEKETDIFGGKYDSNVMEKSKFQSYIISPADKISIIIYDIERDAKSGQTSGVTGFFTMIDFLKKSVSNMSNENEIFYVDSYFLSKDPNDAYLTLAHEFQHMLGFVNKYLKYGELHDTWFTEMMSLVCEDMMYEQIKDELGLSAGDSPQAWLKWFIRYYNYGFTEWRSNETAITDKNDVYISYANAFAFGAYLARNYGGAELIKNIAQNEYVNKEAITYGLKNTTGYTDETFDTVYKKYSEAFVNFGSGIEYINYGAKYSEELKSFNKESSVTVNGVPYKFSAIDFSDYVTEFSDGSKYYGPLCFKDINVELGPYGKSMHILGRISQTGNYVFKSDDDADSVSVQIFRIGSDGTILK